MTSHDCLPLAKSEGIIVREMAGEVLVYHRDKDTASCLNDLAAKVWRCCDGATTPAGIAQRLSDAGGVPVQEALVWLALEELSEASLLEQAVEVPPEVTPPHVKGEKSRRDFLRALAIGTAVVAPIVLNITVPTPAEAASCAPSGEGCTSSAECCSGVCVAGMCL